MSVSTHYTANMTRKDRKGDMGEESVQEKQYDMEDS